MDPAAQRATWLPPDRAEPDWYSLLKNSPGTTVLDLQQFYLGNSSSSGKSPNPSPQKPGGAGTPLADPSVVDYVVSVLRDKQFSSLTELNVNNLNLSLTPIAQALAKNRTLRKISMLHNNFSTDELLQLLGVLLESNYSLTKLQLIEESSLATESNAIEKIFSGDGALRQKQKQVLMLQSVLQRFNEEIQDAVDGRSARLHLAFKLLHWHTKGSTSVEYVRPLATPALGDMFNRMTGTLRSLTIEDYPNDLPQDLFRLTRLEELIIRRVSLAEPPVFLVRLVELQTLCIENCGMMHFDARLLLGMPRIISLSLANNDLRMIPQQIELIPTLERLSLENNRITKVPAAMEKLTSLRTLRLHGNLIKQLPLNLAHLNNLADFTIAYQRAGCEIQGIDAAIVDIERTAIDARQPTLAAYAWLKRTVEGSMIVNRCKLLLVGEANIGKTSTVKSLALFAKGRPVSHLPRKGNVNQALKKNLSVPLNKFRDAVNSALKRTDESSSNPSSPTSNQSSALSQSASANTVSSLSSSQSSTSSTKSNTLRGKNATAAAAAAAAGFDNVATDGIEIQTVVLQTDDVANSSFASKGITLSCWDFAGQDVYLTTHQFFLGKRSIYLIGFRLDQPLDEALSRVEYWLQTIRLRAPNAPIALLGTHLDDYVGGTENLSLLKKSLIERYKRAFNVSDVFFISNASYDGVPEFVRGMTKLLSDRKCRAKLGIEQQRPVTYMVLAESVNAAAKEMEHPVMGWAEWTKFVQSTAMIQDEAEVINATSFLSDVGALLWFNEPQLKDTVVLDCQWLTQVFSSIVTVRTTLIRNGVFRHADLPLLWKHFPSSLHPFMLSILRKFELIYSPSPSWVPPVALLRYLLPAQSTNADTDITSMRQDSALDAAQPIHGGFSIVCSMLPENPPTPDIIEQFWDSDMLETDLSRCYTFKFLPHGFFGRLAVRLLNSDWSLRLIWRSAMIAVKEQHNATLFLSFHADTNEIVFVLLGPRSATQVAPIIDSFNNLMSEWLKEGNVMVFAMVNLPDGSHHKMDIKALEKYVAKGGVFVTISNERIRLDGVVPEIAMAGIVEEAAISSSDLEIGQEVGRGAFATVRRGVYKGQEVAIKQLQLKDDKTSSEMFEEFRREVWLMSRLQHENIVRLLGVSLRPEPSMVMEFMNGGHLFSYLHRSGKKLTWDEKMSLAADVARGMEFIHSTKPPIVHRDLKSPNVLLSHREDRQFPIAKIADFGLSRGLEWSSHYTDKVVDNPTWLAPEVLRKERYNEKVDVYAYGVILFELSTQKQYFGEITFFHELEEKVCEGVRPPIPEDIPSYIRELIQVCWQMDASKRPSFDQIVLSLTTQKTIQELIAEEQKSTPKTLSRATSSRNKLTYSGLAVTNPSTPEAPGGEETIIPPVSPRSMTAAGDAKPTLTRRRSGRDSLQMPASSLPSGTQTPTESRSRSSSSSSASMIDSFRSESEESNDSGLRSRSESVLSNSSTGSRLRKFSISSVLSTSPLEPAGLDSLSLSSTPESENFGWPMSSAEAGFAVVSRKRTNAGAPLPAHLSDRYRRAVVVVNPEEALQAGARGSTGMERSADYLSNTWISKQPNISSSSNVASEADDSQEAPKDGDADVSDDSSDDRQRNSM